MKGLHARKNLLFEVIRYENKAIFILSVVSSRLQHAISSDASFLQTLMEEQYPASFRPFSFEECYQKFGGWKHVPAKLPYLIPGTHMIMFYDIAKN